MLITRESKAALQLIGDQLDRNIYPKIYNGGIVAPSNVAVDSKPMGEEKYDVSQGTRRSAARSWQRSAGWQRSPMRSWPSRRTAPVICAKLRRQYQRELDAVETAYPGSTVWKQETGLWLFTESSVIDGLAGKAAILTALPYSRNIRVRAWAFWRTPVFQQWIGPRHTNFPDGSICAFQPRDGTWVAGQPVVKLLDLFTLWTLRHLHLKLFDRWPGYQSVDFAFERLTEFSDNELCGCQNSHLQYEACCKTRDQNADFGNEAIEFLSRHSFGLRKPPEFVFGVLNGTSRPPDISELTSL